MNEIRYKEVEIISFYSNHEYWQDPTASEQEQLTTTLIMYIPTHAFLYEIWSAFKHG